MNEYQVIKRALVTEKTMQGEGEVNRYAFVVNTKANKRDIQSAIEKLYKVHVTKINTSIVRGKTRRMGRHLGRKPNWKKALVALKQGEKIEIFEGV